MNNKKTFVLDTSVLIHDPSAIFNFEENDVIIPYIVIHEIDGLRKSPNGRGFAAREVIKQIEKFNQETQNLSKVSLGENKGNLSISLKGMPEKLDFSSEIQKSLRDDVIINCAKDLKKTNKNIILVSKDIGQRIKSSVNGIVVQDYLNSKVKDFENRYTGLRKEEVILPPPKSGDPEKASIKSPDFLMHNEFCYVKFEGYENVPGLLYRNKKGRLHLVPDYKKGVCGIKPMDDGQRMAVDLLLDDDVKLIAIAGMAGAGKTILSLAAAIQYYENQNIDSIMYVKPIIPVGGRDLGYLPGDKDEKLKNWAKPLFDNLKIIEMKYGKKYGEEFFTEDINFELEALTYVRGRTLHNTFIMLDECLVGDSLIWLSDGSTIPIKDMTQDESVISLDFKTPYANSNKISNYFKRSTNKILKIRTARGTIECTPEHKLYVYENSMNLIKKEAQDITKNDKILYVNHMNHIVKNDLSKEEAQLAALIICDGTIHKNLYSARVEMYKDQEWLSNICCKIFPSSFKSYNLDYKNNRGYTVCVAYCKKDIEKFMSKYMIPAGKKSNIVIVPPEIWFCPIDTLKSFISMCFDCEGDVKVTEKNVTITFTTTSKRFAYEMQALLAKFDITSNVLSYENKNSNHHIKYRLTIINYFANKFFKEIGFTIPRKQEKYNTTSDRNYQPSTKYSINAFFQSKSLYPQNNKNNIYSVTDFQEDCKINNFGNLITQSTYNKILNINQNNNINIDNYFPCCKILDIKTEILEEPIDVYDFTVENDHTFVVNGIVSSNCQNNTALEARTALSRIGENSKCVLLADLTQIDNPYVDAESCGFSVSVEALKDHPLFGAVPLVTSQRSAVSSLIAERMNKN